MQKKPDHVDPRWLTLKGASHYSGLSQRLLAELISDREVVSSLPRRQGRKSGRRLILRSSLDDFIEKDIKWATPRSAASIAETSAPEAQ